MGSARKRSMGPRPRRSARLSPLAPAAIPIAAHPNGFRCFVHFAAGLATAPPEESAYWATRRGCSQPWRTALAGPVLTLAVMPLLELSQEVYDAAEGKLPVD